MARAGEIRPAEIPAAAASAVADLLRGPDRTGRVLAVTPHAVLVSVDPPSDAGSATGAELLCLAGPRAVRLPCALLLGPGLPAAAPGQRVDVGSGRVRLPASTVVVRRWWPTPEPVLAHPVLAAARRGSLDPPALTDGLDERTRRLTDALGTGGPPLGPAVRALLGRGPGLTPSGDDVLAGAVVTLRAARHAVADNLAGVVAGCRPHERTTAISAALLDHAARGHCIPEVAGLLAALERADSDVSAARHRLLAVGHSSGAALLHGVYAGLEVVGAGSVRSGEP